MGRLKAASLHLSLSIAIIGGIAALGLVLWYPYGLHRVAEFDRILWIMFGIDLVAGPLLTFVVYKPGKRSLVFDLSVIVICQIGFFAYGLHTLWQGRPVFLVASQVRVNLVFANEIEPDELAKAPRSDWRRLSWKGPELVGVLPPSDSGERQDLMFAYFETGIDIHQLPRYFVDYERVKADLISGATRHRKGAVGVPVMSRYGVATLYLDPTSGIPLDSETME